MLKTATKLHTAARDGDIAAVRKALTKGRVDVNSTDKEGRSPLYTGCLNGHLEVVTALIEAGANVNQGNKNNATPLNAASHNGHHDVVQSLLRARADVNIMSNDGRSPLYSASSCGHGHVVKTLIKAAASVNQDDKDGRSPLYMASANGHLEVVKTLIEVGAEVNHSDKDGKTALTVAVEKGNNELIEVLKTYPSKVIQLKAKEVKSTEEKAKRSEQELLEIRKQNDALQQQINLQAQQLDESVRKAEERAANVEQEVVETKQQNDALQIQIRQLAQQEDERAKIAEDRATRAEQELRLSRQQAQAQLRNQITQGTPQNSDNAKFSWRVERDEIEMIEGIPLGAGGWGEVRVAKFRGIKVAAKFLHEAIISQHNIDLFNREMNIAASVRHPNLLLFIGATLDDNKPIILTELMPANLRSIIPDLVRDHVISIGADVARGLNYLHLMRPDPIIHRDVSSANVLVQRTESGYRAKVSDYGSANFLSKLSTIGPGNASYAAPESSNPKLQSLKMDVYSYGILLLEMATGQFPDPSVQHIQLDTLLWEEMKVMIRRCICEDPTNRPTMKDVLTALPQLNK